ncbi:MAG: peptidoglycan DD-metalloendopeptidase family protein [Lewinellaceae bacterium]|nr:peptidoglycan DD-metalloendopeptidase family protein [Saprospiraceae bacterium]MCB9330354.1 peptidoglycan DD-metalloendopeptidase family protein [Lewinellaceae bacterium]
MTFPRTTNEWNSSTALSRVVFLPLLLLLGLVIWAPVQAFGQNKRDLENKRKNLIREIELADKMLKKTTQSKAAALDRYVALQKQIERRESLINTIGAEIAESQNAIDRTADVIESLTLDIQKMRADYGKMVRNAFRRKTLSNPLLYILSASSLNQAFRRWLFLRKYDRFRKTQAEAILATQSMLANKITVLEESRKKQEELLAALQGQKTVLSTELVDKEKLLTTLKKDESRIRSELQQKQAAHEALNQAIERIIQAEISRKVEEARRPRTNPSATAPATPSTPVAAESGTASDSDADIPDDSQTQSFRQNQGRLPWPVQDGVISRGFGRQKHPTIKNIEITNNGVDIRTNDASAVRAVYDGKVAGVQFIPGHDYTVILQHGNYYTVYSNLSETALSKGDRIAAGQTLGRVSTNPISGTTELHFELWYQKKRLNPASWIKK